MSLLEKKKRRHYWKKETTPLMEKRSDAITGKKKRCHYGIKNRHICNQNEMFQHFIQLGMAHQWSHWKDTPS